MEDFIPFEIAVKLKEKGFKEKCLFAYNDNQVINPKVVEEYGNLTDDGYYELTEDCGGKLKFDDVYIYEQQIILQDKIIIKRNFIDAPTISQVLKWLREEKNMFIEMFLYNGKYSYLVKSVTQICEDDLFHECLSEDTANEEYDTYEEAAIAGIEYCLYNLI